MQDRLLGLKDSQSLAGRSLKYLVSDLVSLHSRTSSAAEREVERYRTVRHRQAAAESRAQPRTGQCVPPVKVAVQILKNALQTPPSTFDTEQAREEGAS